MALTFGDHIADIESKKFGSLLFIFGQILVQTIWLYQKQSTYLFLLLFHKYK
jgi:hypothetical protein